MERIRTFLHNGKLIHYFDYRGIEDEATFIEALHAASAFLINENKPSLQIIDLTDVYITKGLITPILTEIEIFKPYVLKEAVLGIVGAKRILFQTYTTFFPGKIKAFSDEEGALAWLTKDEKI